MEYPQTHSLPYRLAWWIFWGTMQTGIVLLYFSLTKWEHFLVTHDPPVWTYGNITFVVGVYRPVGAPRESMLWLMWFLPALLSGWIRWSLLPRTRDAAKALGVFAMGIAIAALSCLAGLYLIPWHRSSLYAAGVIGVFQFMPIGFGRSFAPDSDD